MRLSSHGFLGLVAFATAAGAQQPRAITAADYMRAATFLAPNVNGMVVGGRVSPTWVPDGRFWYRNTTLAGQDPYFRHLYRIKLDGSHAVSLTPGDGDHTTVLSPDGRYVIDTYSTPDVSPVVVLRNGATGASVMPLEKADISKLTAMGWKPPIPIRMKAHDGKKDLDLLLIPNANHAYGAASSYMMRRRWDYFVRWLLHLDPPAGVDLSLPAN